MAYLNGRLPSAALADIYQGRLRIDAARAWRAMHMEAAGRFGTLLRPTGPNSSYRTIAAQRYYWALYKSGRGNLAAPPGTSNHGWGLAVDLATPQMRSIVDRIGAKYGWQKRWSDAPSEWWHLKYRTGVWNRTVHPWGLRVIRHGSRGPDVVTLKRHMRHKGLTGFELTPVMGQPAVDALKRFQKKHGMRADGVAGPKTWHKLQ